MRANNTEQPAIQNQRDKNTNAQQRATGDDAQTNTRVIAQIMAEHRHITIRAATLAHAPLLPRLIHLRIILGLRGGNLRPRQPDAEREQDGKDKQRRRQRDIAPLAPHRLRQLIQKISRNFLAAAALTAVKQLMPLHGQPLQAREQRRRKPGILRIRQLLTQHAVSLRKLTPRLVLVQPAFLPEKKLLQRLPLRLIRGDKLLFLHVAPSIPRK